MKQRIDWLVLAQQLLSTLASNHWCNLSQHSVVGSNIRRQTQRNPLRTRLSNIVPVTRLELQIVVRRAVCDRAVGIDLRILCAAAVIQHKAKTKKLARDNSINSVTASMMSPVVTRRGDLTSRDDLLDSSSRGESRSDAASDNTVATNA